MISHQYPNLTITDGLSGFLAYNTEEHKLTSKSLKDQVCAEAAGRKEERVCCRTEGSGLEDHKEVSGGERLSSGSAGTGIHDVDTRSKFSSCAPS